MNQERRIHQDRQHFLELVARRDNGERLSLKELQEGLELAQALGYGMSQWQALIERVQHAQAQFFKELTMLNSIARSLHNKTDDMRGFDSPDIDWLDMLERVKSVKLMLAKMSETTLLIEKLAEERTAQR